VILLDIKRDNENPIYRQIIDQVSGFIENDTLKKGSILPSSREMANKLGIDRTTVYRAYQELQALGYVESAPGSYTVVRDRPKLVTPARRKDNGKIKWNEKSSQTASQLFETFLQYTPEQSKNMPKDMINLSPLNLDQRLFPVNDFRRCINQEMAYHGAELLQYGNIYGYPPLREYIAYRMQVHGISVDASEILITNGAQHALDLVLNLFCETGTRAAIESPTYANIIPLLNYHNIEILGITGLKILELRGGRNESISLKPGDYIKSGTSSTEMITGKAEILAEKVEVLAPVKEDLPVEINKKELLRLILEDKRINSADFIPCCLLL